MNVATLKRFTIADYHRLIELGFFTETDPVELIRGELIERAAKGTPHTVCGSILCRQLDRLIGDRGVIRGQDPITLPSQSSQSQMFGYLNKHIALPPQQVAIPGFDDVQLDLSRLFLAGHGEMLGRNTNR